MNAAPMERSGMGKGKTWSGASRYRFCIPCCDVSRVSPAEDVKGVARTVLTSHEGVARKKHFDEETVTVRAPASTHRSETECTRATPPGARRRSLHTVRCA